MYRSKQKINRQIYAEFVKTYKELLQVMDEEQIEDEDQAVLVFLVFNEIGLSGKDQKIILLKSMPAEKKQLCQVGLDLHSFSILDVIRASLLKTTERDIDHMLYARRQMLM